MSGESRLKFVASTSSFSPIDLSRLGSGDQPKIICTHDGHFHWDECLAVWFLRQLPAYVNARILRSRDPEEWKMADILVDVGDAYSPEELRFDHHMKGFNVTFSEKHRDVVMSSAGLIYMHFGRDILKQLFPRLDNSDTELEFLYNYAYENYVRTVDAIDNGIPSHYNEDGTEPICRWNDPTTMAGRVNRTYEIAGEDGFGSAYKMAGQDFLEWIQSIVIVYLPSRKELIKAVENARFLHPSGRIIEFLGSGPYNNIIHSVEQELSLTENGPSGNNILFCIHPDGHGKRYRIRTVSTQKGSFAFRLGLPEEWRGLRDEALQQMSGFNGMSFVHKSGFLGGTLDRETALAVAIRLVEEYGK